MKGSLEARTSASQQAEGHAYVAHAPEYLLLDEVVGLLRFDVTAERPREACGKWLRRHGVRINRRGLVQRAALLAAIELESE